MKTKFFALALLAALGFSTGQLAIPSAAADGVRMVDFTSYLQSRQFLDDKYPYPPRAMTAAQRSAVVSQNKQRFPQEAIDGMVPTRTVYRLRNAAFMGLPITQIEEESAHESYGLTVTFADTRFLSLSRRVSAATAEEGQGAVVGGLTKTALFDRNGKRLLRQSQIESGCVGLLIFNEPKRTLSRAGGC
jgi:hypothetical protein